MPLKRNPLGLNRLQLKTLAIFQALAEGEAPDSAGNFALAHLPHPHGDHFHVGPYVAHAADATGLTNQSVWIALARKALIGEAVFPMSVTLTAAGAAYDTGLKSEILFQSHH